MSHLISAARIRSTKPSKTQSRSTTACLRRFSPEWINHNGLTEFKIKVNGDDLKWDVERVLHIDRVTNATQLQRGINKWAYVLDFNEKCPDLDYFMKFLLELKARTPIGFSRIKYVEQPVSRDLKESSGEPHARSRQGLPGRHRRIRHRCPVCPARSRTRLDRGGGVKSPKGVQSNASDHLRCHEGKHLSMRRRQRAARGGRSSKPQIFRRTCRGSLPWRRMPASTYPRQTRVGSQSFPGIFATNDGMLQTSELNGPGLGC